MKTNENKPLLPQKEESISSSIMIAGLMFGMSASAAFISFILTITFNGDRLAVDAIPNPNNPGRFYGTTWCKEYEPKEPLENCLNHLREKMSAKLMIAGTVLGVSLLVVVVSLIAIYCESHKKYVELKQAGKVSAKTLAKVNDDIEQSCVNNFKL